jgi:hypothetical protein
MIDKRRPAAVGFHSGEPALEHHAGVQAQAARPAPMVGPAELCTGMAAFIAQATFAALTGRATAGGYGRHHTSNIALSNRLVSSEQRDVIEP